MTDHKLVLINNIMENINFETLLLKTAFCCMAADGDIDKREVETIERLCKDSEYFKDIDFQTEINKFVEDINTNSRLFIQEYFDMLAKYDLSEKENLEIINFALETIHADEIVDYSEIKFFKNIRHRINLSDETIIDNFKNEYPEIEDFLEDDIKTDNFLENITKQYFETFELPQFNLIKDDIISND